MTTLAKEKPVRKKPQKPTSPFRGNRPATPADFTGHVMIDLETMGTRPGCVILSIGAVYFTCNGIHEEFYIRINPISCQRAGLHFDASTIEWWMRQTDGARGELSDLTKTGEELDAALLAFSKWLRTEADHNSCIWGNGSDFDISILIGAYDRADIPVPWSPWKHRCFRTMKNFHRHTIAATEPAREGTHHNALDDAKHQAKWLIAISEVYGINLK